MHSPQHVLFIPSWYPQFPGDPSGSFFREQAIALAQCLQKVGILFPNQRSLKQLLNPSRKACGTEFFVDNKVNVATHQNFNWTPRFEKGIAFQWKIHGLNLFNEYIKKHGRPDVIHAHCALYAGYLAKKISEITGIPYVVTEHSSGYFKGLIKGREITLSAEIFSKSSANIAVSSSLVGLLQKNLGFGHSWQVIPNIVENNFYTTPIHDNRTTGRLRLLHVALLIPIKRQLLLIESIDLCRQAGKGLIELTIAGEGPERGELEREIRLRGLQEHVKLIGMVARPKIPELMASHDAFVLSSDYETFGVVVAEALASGLSCITTDCGGPVDIISTGDGSIVPRGDAVRMANAMLNLLDQQEDLQIKLKRRNRSRARFSGDAVCHALTEVYGTVLSRDSI